MSLTERTLMVIQLCLRSWIGLWRKYYYTSFDITHYFPSDVGFSNIRSAWLVGVDGGLRHLVVNNALMHAVPSYYNLVSGYLWLSTLCLMMRLWHFQPLHSVWFWAVDSTLITLCLMVSSWWVESVHCVSSWAVLNTDAGSTLWTARLLSTIKE